MKEQLETLHPAETVCLIYDTPAKTGTQINTVASGTNCWQYPEPLPLHPPRNWIFVRWCSDMQRVTCSGKAECLMQLVKI